MDAISNLLFTRSRGQLVNVHLPCINIRPSSRVLILWLNVLMEVHGMNNLQTVSGSFIFLLVSCSFITPPIHFAEAKCLHSSHSCSCPDDAHESRPRVATRSSTGRECICLKLTISRLRYTYTMLDCIEGLTRSDCDLNYRR